ncbi:MAG TPA: type IV pilus modification protein PilV [Hydrogenophaga sp.]|uniref:type IV pilus modification protein PilV n=1 Tax=Hydrogenophaga sp. TaxID=1904254 RepID=UPI002CEB5103|nr:type IV pilus modification protein PilV [Hydrogenophaga sp.]HSX95346.1 type IV pilus modification protein PilV [Hydrogenophaga sp.]
MSNERLASPRRNAGSTLIEVLIALLIACIGLLAMTRLAASALGHQKAAQMRLLGQTLAQQYAERARLNVYGFDLGGYDISLGDSAPEEPALNADATDLAAASAMAQADQREFLQAVANALPNGRAQAVARRGVATTARDLDVWLLWRDTPVDDADSLDSAARRQCPQGLKDADRRGASCMHFRVGL